MSNMNDKGLLSATTTARRPLDIHCPSHYRIQSDIHDPAFQQMIARHGDLQCLRCFPWHVFSVWPGSVSNVMRGPTSTDNTTRRDSRVDAG